MLIKIYHLTITSRTDVITVGDNRVSLRECDVVMDARLKDDETPTDAADIPKFDSEEYILRKRLPRRFPKRQNDVYISTKTDFRAQLARHVDHLLDT